MFKGTTALPLVPMSVLHRGLFLSYCSKVAGGPIDPSKLTHHQKCVFPLLLFPYDATPTTSDVRLSRCTCACTMQNSCFARNIVAQPGPSPAPARAARASGPPQSRRGAPGRPRSESSTLGGALRVAWPSSTSTRSSTNRTRRKRSCWRRNDCTCTRCCSSSGTIQSVALLIFRRFWFP